MRVTRIAASHEKGKKCVAAYARVSTLGDDQEESFENQVSYYQRCIRDDPAWEFVAVYADHGITGTSVQKRPAFQQMIQTALTGGIDIILVKSISRFSRNVVDCQRIVEALKAANVEVRFEREGISSFDPTSGFIFSLLSAVAQDESRSISENVRWGIQERFRRGVFCLGNNRILGYDTDPVTKKLVPNQDAWIIRLIFQRFLENTSYRKIAAELNAKGANRLRSRNPFGLSAIQYIVSNETYVGDKRLQKHAPVNFLTKQPDPNAEYVTYYLRDDHEGIIDRATWDRAQAILAQRRRETEHGIRKNGTAHHVFYGKVFCAGCGEAYTRRTFTVKGKAGKRFCHAWNCRARQKGKQGNGCRARTVRETDLEELIARQMGWPSFCPDRLEAEIEKVLVTASGIQIERASPCGSP